MSSPPAAAATTRRLRERRSRRRCNSSPCRSRRPMRNIFSSRDGACWRTRWSTCWPTFRAPVRCTTGYSAGSPEEGYITLVFLIDASVYVYRAYHSVLPDNMVDHEGNPVQAVFGFARFLGDLIERMRPRHIAVAFDQRLSNSYRSRIY